MEDFFKFSIPNCFLQNTGKATIMETDIRKGENAYEINDFML